jgi:uncharacterized membrane protein YgcG
MTWLVLGASLVIGGILVMHWFVDAEVKKVLRVLRWVGIGLIVIAGGFLLISGRLAWLWIVAMGLLPWITRLRMLRRLAQSARGPRRGNQSQVDTRFVAMTLDHDTGDMDGEVREGPYAGRRLSDMNLEELVALYRAAREADAPSASVLESYLERFHGDTWRARDGGPSGGGGSGGGGGDGRMTKEEAYRILNLESDASAAEIHKSHRELMKKMHPDHGGSDYLAAKINEAKEKLLAK